MDRVRVHDGIQLMLICIFQSFMQSQEAGGLAQLQALQSFKPNVCPSTTPAQ